MKHQIFENDLPDSVTLKGAIAIDTESLGLNIKRDRLCLAQIADETGSVYFVKFNGKDYTAPNLRKILMDENTQKIFHFARFDVGTLSHYLQIDEIKNIFCTKIASKLTRTYTDAHGLKALCKELLDVELEKESQTSNWSLPNLTEKQLKYAANDVLYLHRIKNTLEKMLEETGRTQIANQYFKIMQTVCKCDILGFDAASILNH